MCAGCDRIGNYSRQGQCGRTFPRTATASLRAGWDAYANRSYPEMIDDVYRLLDEIRKAA